MSLRKISLMGPSCLHIESSFGFLWESMESMGSSQHPSGCGLAAFQVGHGDSPRRKGDLSNKNGGPMGSEWVNNWGDVGRHVCMLRYAKEDSPNIKHIHRIIYSKWKTNRESHYILYAYVK
jgi:hypothetical protein